MPLFSFHLYVWFIKPRILCAAGWNKAPALFLNVIWRLHNRLMSFFAFIFFHLGSSDRVLRPQFTWDVMDTWSEIEGWHGQLKIEIWTQIFWSMCSYLELAGQRAALFFPTNRQSSSQARLPILLTLYWFSLFLMVLLLMWGWCCGGWEWVWV